MQSSVLSCLHCGGTQLVSIGAAPNGKRRYRCNDCRKHGTENLVGRAYPEAFRAQVLAAYQERCSMRGVCRVFGISRNTLIAWLKKSQ